MVNACSLGSLQRLKYEIPILLWLISLIDYDGIGGIFNLEVIFCAYAWCITIDNNANVINVNIIEFKYIIQILLNHHKKLWYNNLFFKSLLF